LMNSSGDERFRDRKAQLRRSGDSAARVRLKTH
jgi:hypothetical protein